MRVFRTLVAVVFSSGALLALAPVDGWATSAKVTKACKTFATLQGDMRAIGTAEFDGSAFTEIGAAFRKASKNAPKQVKGALTKIAKSYESLSGFETRSEAEAASRESAQTYAKSFAKFASYYAANCSSEGTTSSGGSGGRGGSLTFGDETIALASARCYLQEQPAAGGGGKILLTGQGSGKNADGDDVRLDFTRYDEDSQFTGDDISVDIGPVTSSESWGASGLPTGTVSRSGSTLSGSDIQLQNYSDDGSLTTMTASFELNC